MCGCALSPRSYLFQSRRSEDARRSVLTYIQQAPRGEFIKEAKELAQRKISRSNAVNRDLNQCYLWLDLWSGLQNWLSD